MKTPDFISFLSESRDNSKVMITILVQTARREFACCASLGERLTTHKGVTARLL